MTKLRPTVINAYYAAATTCIHLVDALIWYVWVTCRSHSIVGKVGTSNFHHRDKLLY